MIYHLGEIWVLLAVVFCVGGLVGSLFHRALALGGARRPQAWLIRRIDFVVDNIEQKIFPGRGRFEPLPVRLPVEFVPVAVPLATAAFDETAFLPGESRPATSLVIEHEPVEAAPAATSIATLPVQRATEEPRRSSKKFREALERANAAGVRPLPLKAPRRDSADELVQIKRIGKRNAAKLAELGIYHFSQIAAWTPQEMAWVSAFLNVGTSPQTEDWTGQATRLASSEAFPMVRPVAEAPASLESNE